MNAVAADCNTDAQCSRHLLYQLIYYHRRGMTLCYIRMKLLSHQEIRSGIKYHQIIKNTFFTQHSFREIPACPSFLLDLIDEQRCFQRDI